MSLVVKAFLCSSWSTDEPSEIRRFSIDQDVATSYTYLTQKIAQVFSNLKADEVRVTYIDEDGDRISISSDEELTYALEQLEDSKLLRLYLTKSSGHGSWQCPQFSNGCCPLRYRCYPSCCKQTGNGTGAESGTEEDHGTQQGGDTEDTEQHQGDDTQHQGDSENAHGLPNIGFCGPFTEHPFAAGFRFRPFGGPRMRSCGRPGFRQGAGCHFGPGRRGCGPRAWGGNPWGGNPWGGNPWGARGWGQGQGGWWSGCCDDWSKCGAPDQPTTTNTTNTTAAEDHFEKDHKDHDTEQDQ